ncbi:hypothetical protein IQ266_07875 [filamentous cyanobacterium LEGE 11480]|uniref:Uncharacterized protein n=1 Tax=Romeriopsis navalis LEGE 11480 TaxID=2777977 RepID=A0A928Z3U4_9CYAN|nr:hypothetical protein [Romeriopsis navalis]MBE9029645.1 hypothetical protein [Romeriopsis navalis LEGE 11480]
MPGISDLMLGAQPLAAAGSFPAAFAAVYVLGAIAAFVIGFAALKKARSVNAERIQDDSGD